MVLVLLLSLLASLAISLPAALVLVRIGRRASLLDTPGAGGHAKAVVHRTPNIGGIAIVLGVLVPIAGALLVGAFAGADAFTGTPLEPVGEHLPGLRERLPMALTLMGAIVMLHIVGLVDDRRAMAWLPKLSAQAIAAVALVGLFPEVRLLEALDAHVSGSWLSITLTVVWFITITNAMNFLDNMDGLSGGVALIATLGMLLAASLSGQWFIGALLASLAGALLGFLALNFPWPSRSPRGGRARLFMGDGGSLVVGFLLAFATVRTTYFAPADPGVGGSAVAGGLDAGAPGAPELLMPSAGGGWWGVLMPLCVLAIPLYDLVSVSAIRISQGRSPLVGDEQHFSHRLRRRGLTIRQTLAVVYACTAITAIAGVLLLLIESPLAALVGVQVALVLVMLAIWEYGSSLARRDNAP